MWPDRRILDLLAIDLPILQAPMAGAQRSALAIAVAGAGGLGAIPCGMLGPAEIRAEVAIFRRATTRPLNLNFFCHAPPSPDPARETTWRHRLAPYYRELGLPLTTAVATSVRAPFDDALCELVEDLRPDVLSFHFGLPDPVLLARVRATGARILASATTVAEARWLAARGCHAIIAQGVEAGGHRGMFLGDDLATQVGTMALVPQIVDAVDIPVIAAGGLGDARGIVAALALGAAAVQLGTAYLLCPETTIAAPHRAALRSSDPETVLTNVFTGRPARGLVNRLVRELGPISALAPAYPLAAIALAPLRARSDADGSDEFMPLWSGQAVHLARELPAAELTRQLAAEALARLTAPPPSRLADPDVLARRPAAALPPSRIADSAAPPSSRIAAPQPPSRPADEPAITRDQINALPLARYEGPITVVASPEDLAAAVEALGHETLLGFDTESRPSFRPGEDHPVSLLQLAGAERVYLFQLPWLGDLTPLFALLADPAIHKAGVAVADDIRKLQALAPFKPQSFVDIGHLARSQDIRAAGLRSLAGLLLGIRVGKNARTSNWSHRALTPAQVTYAATDAWIGRLLYHKLIAAPAAPSQSPDAPA